jgi:hypothetical protein
MIEEDEDEGEEEHLIPICERRAWDFKIKLPSFFFFFSHFKCLICLLFV